MNIIPLWWLPDWLALIMFVLCALGVVVCLFDREDQKEHENAHEFRDLQSRLLADDWEHFLDLDRPLGGSNEDVLRRLREFVGMAEEFKTLAAHLSYEDLQQFAEQDAWAWKSQKSDKPVSTEFLLARNVRLRKFLFRKDDMLKEHAAS